MATKKQAPIVRAAKAVKRGNDKIGNSIWNDIKGMGSAAVDFGKDAKGSLDYLGNGMINAGKWAVTAPKPKMGPPAPKGTTAARPRTQPSASPGSSASRPQGYDPRGVPGSSVRMGAAPMRGGGHAPAALNRSQIQNAYNARTPPAPVVAIPRSAPRYTPASAAPVNRAAALRKQAQIAARTGDYQTAATQLVQSYSPGTAEFYSEPRSMQEFMAALSPAQLASPEVQSLLETFLNDAPVSNGLVATVMGEKRPVAVANPYEYNPVVTGPYQNGLPSQLVTTGMDNYGGERRPVGNSDPWASVPQTPMWTNDAPAVDPVETYRQQIMQRAATNDAAMSQKWLQPAVPLQGNLMSEPRSMQEFMAALSPAQLASPEVQSLLETFLNNPYA